MNTLKVGDKAFAFDALDQDGTRRTLADYAGQKLIVFFYPAASTPGCTAEACNLTDNYSALQQAGYAILGVSADNASKQKKFQENFFVLYLTLLQYIYTSHKNDKSKFKNNRNIINIYWSYAYWRCSNFSENK